VNSDITFGALERFFIEKYPQKFHWGSDSKLFNRYANGTRTPNVRRLELFEQIYQGTQRIFEFGPDHSSLWRALSCRDVKSARKELFCIKSEIRHGFYAELPVTNAPIPGVQCVFVPASLAHSLELSDLKSLSDCLLKNPDLRNSLSALTGGLFAHYAAGPLLDLTPDITFSLNERQPGTVHVTPPALTGFSMQLLQAQIDGASSNIPPELGRQWDIERRLADFGLSLEHVARIAGRRFYKLTMQLMRAERVTDTAAASTGNPTTSENRIRWKLPSHTVQISADGGGAHEFPGPVSMEFRTVPSTGSGSEVKRRGR
jgi:hypothetical protein